MRCLAALLFASSLFGAAPVIFFTDLVNGPNSGGENGDGAYVTLYGVNFGATRGTSTVTVGGGAPAQYKVWSAASWGGPAWTWYDKATIQLGASATTGNIVMTTTGGTSNAIAFTVRSGSIYFVSTTGSDGAAGTFAAPWATCTHARDTMAQGGTVYYRTGTYCSTDDGSGYSTCLKLGSGNQGTSGSPNAMLAYPGESVTFGDTTACGITIRGQGTSNENYWVFAGFAVIIGNQITLNPYGSHDWRILGNASMTCPNGNGQSGCLDIGGGLDGSEYNYWVYGNNINHAGTNNSPGSVTALYHGVYLSQQIHAIDFGWNVISNVYGGRCVQENVNGNNATDRAGSYDMHIHDNVIHDCQNDGIVMTTMNPAVGGTTELYNNILYNTGIGPANLENSGAWNGMNLQGWENTGVTGESGVYQVFNNSTYATGTWTTPPFAGSSGAWLWEDGNTSTKSMNYLNNISQITTGPMGIPYFNVYSPNTSTCSSMCAAVTGSHNVVYGAGSAPTNTTATSYVNSDPLFTAPGSADFSLQSGSPARGIGASGCPTLDIMGKVRGSPCDAGAIEFSAGSPTIGGSLSTGKVTISGKVSKQ